MAQKPPLLPEKDVAALAQELSGETAKRNLEGLARYHRQRGSQGFHAAAELIAERARAYGLSETTILQLPADGKIFYGAQRSRPAWDAESAELWELREHEVMWLPDKLLGSYEAEPIVLAEDSESADVTSDLVDVGDGTKESDYAGKDVKSQIVLAAAQPGAVQDLAVGKFGAAGIVSYAQNQKTAWWGEDDNLIRWGHLETFSSHKTFGFMVSLKTARGLRERLGKGEHIRLHATVKAGLHPGYYEIVTATIPGTDPKLKGDEIAFSCHLDHQRPGANDNASGCVTILEVARTLQKLISRGQLAPPARTIRFIWPPEIEGTMALLNGKPEFPRRIKAVVHMDMVGGGPVTKAVFHVTRGPMSLPSFIHDVAWAFGDFVNEQSYKFAATGEAEYPLVAPEGGKEPLLAQDTAFTMGSDNNVYEDSSFHIPAIYLNDWPDRYIHTNFDTAANIDPTKLKRAAFIGAASGYFLAQLSPSAEKLDLAPSDTIHFYQHRAAQAPSEAATIVREGTSYAKRCDASLAAFLNRSVSSPSPSGAQHPADSSANISAKGDGLLVFTRKPEPKGPLTVFGYDFSADHAQGSGLSTPKLLSYEGIWGTGEEYAFETVNLANGTRNAQEIRDTLTAEYGPIPVELVVEYLRWLEKVGVVDART